MRRRELLVGVLAVATFSAWLVALIQAPPKSAIDVAVMADSSRAVRLSAVAERTLSRVPFDGEVNGVRVARDIARAPPSDTLVVSGTVDGRPVHLTCAIEETRRRLEWVRSVKPAILGARKLALAVEGSTLVVDSPTPEELGIDVLKDGSVVDVAVIDVPAGRSRHALALPDGVVVVHAAPPLPGARGAWAVVGMTPPTGKEPARLRADALPCAAARERDDRARLAFVGCAIALLLSIAIGARKAIIPMIVSVALVAAILLGLYVALLVVAG